MTLLAAIAIAGLCGVAQSVAQQTNNGAPVCVVAQSQYAPHAVPDGSGGLIVVWYDNRQGSTDLFAQRLSPQGALMWTTAGVPVATGGANRLSPSTAADGNGGVVVVWEEVRTGSTYDIYAQRLDASGVRQWGGNGQLLTGAPGNERFPIVAHDGAGGAIFTWTDDRSGSLDIYAQRVDAAGTPQWGASGLLLCGAVSSQIAPVIASDTFGGAIVAWEDLRSGVSSDIYAQHIDPSGTPLWATNGVPICTAPNLQESPSITPDGSNGAIVAWRDYRSGLYDVYAQRVSGIGATAWTPNGVPVVAAPNNQYEQEMLGDGVGGMFVVWKDERGNGDPDVYMQHLDATGAPQWQLNGLPICTFVGTQIGARVISDGMGGAIVAWFDMRNAVDWDVYAQRVSGIGTVLWEDGGLAICASAASQTYPAMVSDVAGGATIVWADTRYAAQTAIDLFAQRVTGAGAPVFADPEPPKLLSVRDVLNDQGGKVKLTWDATLLDRDALLIGSFWIWRSVPAAIVSEAVSRGARLGTDPASAGYDTNLLVTRTSGGTEYYWEFVTSQPTGHLGKYSYTAATTADSVAGGNPHTTFMVQAWDVGATRWWFSNPDSGYSVDNLAPPIPIPFTASYTAASNALHWHASRAPDLGAFRLHRGTALDFVPGPSNLVVATRDTGYIDAPGASYYKLAAVDVHGNVSRYALVSPGAPVATLASLVSVDAQNDRVRLVWYTADGSGAAATVYRRTLESDWAVVDQIAADGTGYLRYEDAAVTSGTRYGYRLGIMDEGQEAFAGEVWVEVPALQLALRGATPNPAVGGRLRVEFTLGGQGPARIDMIDIAGRVVRTAEVSSLGPGAHSFELAGDSPLRPGIYFLRLRQSGQEARARIAVID